MGSEMCIRDRFENADLSNASFANADMLAARLDGAILNGADLSAALNLTTEQLSNACADPQTKLPEGIVAPRC